MKLWIARDGKRNGENNGPLYAYKRRPCYDRAWKDFVGKVLFSLPADMFEGIQNGQSKLVEFVVKVEAE